MSIPSFLDSSIAFLIQYVDFFAQMQEQASLNFQYLKVYAVTGAVYLLLVSLVIFASKRLETRYAIPHWPTKTWPKPSFTFVAGWLLSG